MQVDFYLLDKRSITDVVCLLVARAWPTHRNIVITGPPELLDTLDASLWEKPDGRFLPHERAEESSPAPIQLKADLPETCEVLIHLHRTSRPPEGTFDRVLEVVDSDEADRAPARDRFRAWKAAGIEPSHHRL